MPVARPIKRINLQFHEFNMLNAISVLQRYLHLSTSLYYTSVFFAPAEFFSFFLNRMNPYVARNEMWECFQNNVWF